jgi:phosphorylase kinase alpha/beta subunit
MPPAFHNRELERLHAAEGYSVAQVEAVAAALEAHGTFSLAPLATGLYPAPSSAVAGGGRLVSVRDNVYVALALWRAGRPEAAAAVARGLLAFYGKYRYRFDVAVVAAGFDARDVMTRPHVRFDGAALEELGGAQAAHAQNDALGYGLWLAATLASAGVVVLTGEEVVTLQALVRYFEAIRFWDDEDSGHWEETRRISASSIGTVDAGLRAWRELLRAAQARDVRLAGITIPEARVLEVAATALIDEAGRALVGILPAECVQLPPRQHRRYDAALLVLIHPLGVVQGPLAGLMLDDVHRYLQGAVGIRRYLGDAWWGPGDERRPAIADRGPEDERDLEGGDVPGDAIGREAQWCVFDPLLSALYGERARRTGAAADRARQVRHFNRALAHVTEDWVCPDLYYERDGVPVPLAQPRRLWTRAALRLALSALRETARG